MSSRVRTRNALFSAIVFVMLTQCQSFDLDYATPTSAALNLQINTSSFMPLAKTPIGRTETATSYNQKGCHFPPNWIALDVEKFYWSEDSKAIIYKMQDRETWHQYNIIPAQVDSSFIESTSTPLPSYHIESFAEAFVSPSKSNIIFTRGTPEKYEVFYKEANEYQEYSLGILRGYIKEVDWFDNEKQAVIAMEWQLPIFAEAPVYLIDIHNRTLTVEIPRLDDYRNIEYLDVTPDGKQIMFLSFAGKDRTAKLWNIATNEISFTPIFNPWDFQWRRENELISVHLASGLTDEMNLLVYDIKQSKIVFLAERKIRAAKNSGAIQISPNGLHVAFIENETRNLIWVECDF